MDLVKATQGKVTGAIIPPPEIRAVVDKTASFVAKIGKSFEQRILSSAEGQTAKFNFMKPFDPYHAYYEMKIKEGEDGITNGGTEESKTESVKPAAPAQQDTVVQAQQAQQTSTVATAVKASILNPIAQLAQTKPTEAPPELEFCVAQGQPAGLTPLDVDIIKLAAQYTAINGREFLANLALREQRNPQYDFLKPTHMLFSYFTYLVDCYAKILHPSPALVQQVEARCEWRAAMEAAVRRWQWTRAEEERRRVEGQQDDQERLAFQAIDWMDFTVVETIDFPEDELLDLPSLGGMDLVEARAPPPPPPAGPSGRPPAPPPPPRAPAGPSPSISTSTSNTTSSSYYAPHAASAAEEGGGEGAMDEGEGEFPGEDLSDLRVVADYQHSSAGPSSSSSSAGASSQQQRGGAALLMVDPISGKAVPVDQLSEHMRVQLLDPRWRQQQQKFVDKQKETGFAEGGSIADSLKNFARKRGDIFGQAAAGSGENSAAFIAEQEALERRKAEIQGTVQWDGHYGSIGSVQQLKHEVAARAPGAFQLPASAVKSAPLVGPSLSLPLSLPLPSPSAAPVVAHYALPPAGAPPMPPVPAPVPLFPPSAYPVPPPPPSMLPQPPHFPPPAPAPVPAHAPTEEPASKRAKTEVATPSVPEEPALLSAEAFLAQYGGPGAQASLQVSVPAVGAAEGAAASWNLNGQTLALQVPLACSVKQLKETLAAQHLGGIPANKLQLRFGIQGFLKDATSLAEANVPPGALLELSLKSRGGRR